MTKPMARPGSTPRARGGPATAFAELASFDEDDVGAPPAGWTAGLTGRATHRRAVTADAGAPGGHKVLKQSAHGDFPWCVKQSAAFADGYVEVRFKPLAGRQDRAGGVVRRWQDTDNYYIARANALENNVALYCTRGGRRDAIEYAEAPVAKDRWHGLRVEFAGSHIAVALDGRRYIEQQDSRIAGAGAVGVWTKADSVTVFSDFSDGRAPK